jgi:hypothetical protein
VEGLQALHALDISWRKTWAGLLGAPVLAGLWDYTSAMVAAFEAGEYDPRGFGQDAWEIAAMVWRYLTIALHELAGKTGLHLVLGGLVAAAVGVGCRGWAVRRRLDRTIGLDVLREMAKGRLVRSNEELAAMHAAAQSRPRPTRAGRSPIAVTAGILTWLVPLASAGLTVRFAWVALTR